MTLLNDLRLYLYTLYIRLIIFVKRTTPDNSYRNEVNRIADIWQDEPRQPIDEATYWLELLIKYKNFDHWKINDFELNFIQYFSVDVILFLLFSFCFPLYLSILYLKTYYGTIHPVTK